MTTLFLYLLLYAGAIVFFAGCVVRAVRYAKEPIHLRWEIYPVPQGRAGQLKVMLPEILFLKGLWEFNRPMWYWSYPFHLGLYLLAAGAAFGICAAFAPRALFPLLPAIEGVCGTAGCALGLVGALGLLTRRCADRELRMYSTRGDFLNLIFFAITFGLLIAGYWLRPEGSPGPLAMLRGAATFDTKLKPSGALLTGLVAAALLLAYIPMTHMVHFIAKYFTYHAVRWDERANVAGGSLQKRMAEYLMYRPTWAAPHIGTAGDRTWAEIAGANPAQGGGK